MAKKITIAERRTTRNRFKLKSVSDGRYRLSVFKSNVHTYAQIIDDKAGHTLASASSLGLKAGKGKEKQRGMDKAAAVGKLVAERALKANIKDVAFDRGGYRYHGRVKALADAAREAGLNF